MSKATNDLTKILDKLSKRVGEAIEKTAMIRVGDFAKDLIVKRTRLGYGVDSPLKDKSKLAKLKQSYILDRQKFSGLSSLTRPNRSNLTRTGSMLDSMRAKYVRKGTVLIQPTGTRNILIAGYHTEPHTFANGYTRPARIFNNVSRLEFEQVLRFYRKNFSDLVKKSFKGSLIR